MKKYNSNIYSKFCDIVPQTVWTHLGVLTVVVKQLCLDRCGSLLFTAYIRASRSRRHAFRLRRLAKSGWRRRVLVATALSLCCRAHFRTWWSLCMAGARETSCFGGPKSTFRDRCKGSERLYFEVQISWQVQHFGHEAL